MGVMPDLDATAVLGALARDPRLRVFLGEDRIETIPAKQSRRRLMLEHIAQAFEPGLRYSEQRVSTFLGTLIQEGYTIYLWKLSFKDGLDDRLVQVAVRDGKVAGFVLTAILV